MARPNTPARPARPALSLPAPPVKRGAAAGLVVLDAGPEDRVVDGRATTTDGAGPADEPEVPLPE